MKRSGPHLQLMQRQEVSQKVERHLVYAADTGNFRDPVTAD